MPTVRLVWDGENFQCPAECGMPRPDQLQGSPLDRLVELAGRVCYDSLGGEKSRNSQDYHAHISQVGHGSVHEHANLTLQSLPLPLIDVSYLALAFINRPGVIFRTVWDLSGGGYRVRVTTNVRAARDWHLWGDLAEIPFTSQMVQACGLEFRRLFTKAAPMAMADRADHSPQPRGAMWAVVPPEYDAEVWVSLFFEGTSRGLSHEQVRHKFRTAVSQRSTRFCDESESNWVPHPLLTQSGDLCMPAFSRVEECGKKAYDEIVSLLVPRLKAQGLDGTSARKQARGAARGVLGNALETKFIFSASVAAWKWMMKLRAADPADAEIRLAFSDGVFPIMKERFPERWLGWERRPGTDGLADQVVYAGK
jgi:hypothetical protein